LAAFFATLRAAFSDAGAVLLLLVASLAYSFFYPYPYGGEKVEQVPAAIVDQDASPLSRQLARLIQASPQVQAIGYGADAQAAERALMSGEISGFVLIPRDFQRDVKRGRKLEVLVGGNAAYPLVSKALMSGTASAAGTLSAAIDLRRFESRQASSRQALETAVPVNYIAKPLFNTDEGYGSYVVPGVAPLIVQQTLIIGISLLFGLWTELKSSTTTPLPVRLQKRPVAGFLGLWAAFALIGFLNTLYFSGFVFHVQDYPQHPDLVVLFAFAALFALAISAFGLFLGHVFNERERGMQTLLFSSIPMLFVSGFPWPTESLPELIQWLRWIIPSTAGIQGALAINQLGAGFAEVRSELIALALHALVWALAAFWLFRRRWRATR
jgi:ABC-2 type transport system permease protein